MKKQVLSITILLVVIVNYSSVKAQNPILWGVTYSDGANGVGNIFKYDVNATITDTCDFNTNGDDGTGPVGALIKASNGLLYGMTYEGGTNDDGIIFSYNTQTNKETNVHSFGNDTDGQSPYNGSLLQVNDSLLYGLTEYGGSNGEGVIFSFNINSGIEKDVYDFGIGTDGTSPYGSLMKASNGLLYGMTYSGGVNDEGTIFSFNTATNTEIDLHDFGNGNDGQYPYGNFIQVNDSLLCGMTSSGGANNEGIILTYNIVTNKETDKYDFYVNGLDAAQPYGSLLKATNGLLYGLTYAGGDDEGTIFSFNMADDSEKVLHLFGSGQDGQDPYGSLIQASNGLLYGMTETGGANIGGTIFSYDITGGTETDVYDFSSTSGDEPYGDLLQADSTTGINQLTINSNQLSVYPNPTKGAITISSSKNIDEVTVTNLVGQVIYTAQPKQTSFNFELKDEGMYFVTVKTGDGIETQKVIVAR